MPISDRNSEALALAQRVREGFPDPGWPADRRVSGGPKEDLDVEYVDEHFMGKRWQEITGHALVWTAEDSWAFSDEGLAYFLPAFLVLYLEEGYPEAANIGDIHLELWLLHRLAPLRSRGFSREQAELILNVWRYIIRERAEDEDIVPPSRVEELLDVELAEWRSH
jgi:hypothetical protein